VLILLGMIAWPSRSFPLIGGFGAACAGVEGFARNLAAELGPKGVRVVCLRSAGSPESITETMDAHASGNRVTRDEFVASLAEMTMLKRLPSLADVGNVAALMASDHASSMTSTVANMTCGQMAD
jgi:3-oxoacyl-[acyl-carrier protein] reductase